MVRHNIEHTDRILIMYHLGNITQFIIEFSVF